MRREMPRAAACLLSVAALGATVAAAPAASAATGAPRATSAPYSVDSDPSAFLKSGAIGSAVLRWNPCSAIRYAVNTTGAPAGFANEARRAVAELAHTSGLKLTYVGTTKLRPQLTGSNTLATAPMKAAHLNLVIAWDTRSAAHSLLKLQAGEAGETLRMSSGGETVSGTRVVVSPTQYHFAAISLDRSAEAGLVHNDKHGNGLYHLLLHELGHAVGLNHVTSGSQIMYPVGGPNSAVHYGAGDKAGLKAVGFNAGCL